MPTVDANGRWRDKTGAYTPKGMVTVDKQLEDELVEALVHKAKRMRDMLAEFKKLAYSDSYDFIDMLRQEYGMDRMEKSKQGSITLKSFDGTKEVSIQVTKLIQFDAKLSLAKEMIDEYLTEKTEHADPEIQTLIMRAFDVKNGKVDAKEIFKLKSYPIKHEKWIAAMKIIDEATEIAGTKSYIRFKEREHGAIDGRMENIALDLATLPVSEKDISAVREVRKIERKDDDEQEWA
jgi:hypothetical protein